MSKLFSEDILNKMRLRIRNRYLSNKHIDELCQEYKIHIKLYYLYYERTEGHRVEKIRCNHKNFIGVSEENASYKIDMNIYKKHYFLEEATPFYTHTVCVPYYKATPYNISHTKIFLMAIFTLIFFL